MAHVADFPQPIVLQLEKLQFREQLEALDLPQLVTTYILSGLLRLRWVRSGQPLMVRILSIWQYLIVNLFRLYSKSATGNLY